MDKFKKGLSDAFNKAKEARQHHDSPNHSGPQSQQPIRNHDAPSQSNDPGSTDPITPKLKGEPQVLGLVGDPGLNRDSGGSTRFGDRVLWTYRDTQLCEPTGKVQTLPIITSTASWSDLDTLQPCHGDPLSTNVLHQYGHNRTDEAFFPNLPHICQSPAGNLTSGERVALWPDTPPLVTHEAPDGSDIVAYSWIRRSHIGTGTDLTVKTPNPATILYKTHHHSSRWRPADSHHALPSVSVVADSFWNQGEIPFGAYGNLRHPSDGHVYLYGQTDEDGQPRVVSLARVPCEKVEDRAAYEYFVGGEWTREMPRMYQDGIALDKCGVGGQGTFFWNPHWRKFCWIGGDCFPGAETYLCMAPRPEGPWTDGWRFYTGSSGKHFLGAYSIQAHPALCTNPEKNEMYISYTKCDEERYTTPLVRVEFE